MTGMIPRTSEKRADIFTKNVLWIPNSLRRAINPRSNDKSDGDGNDNVKRNMPTK